MIQSFKNKDTEANFNGKFVRPCFRWTQAGPDAVEIVDYH